MNEKEQKFAAWVEGITFVSEDGTVLPVPTIVEEDPEADND